MSTEEISLEELQSQYNEQETLRREKLVELQNQGKDPFDVYKVERTHMSVEIKDNFETLEETTVTVAGRIMSKRGQGKVVFSDIQDRDGRIQLFIKIDAVGEENLKAYKTYDLGDWVAATGTVFKTKTGDEERQTYSSLSGKNYMMKRQENECVWTVFKNDLKELAEKEKKRNVVHEDLERLHIFEDLQKEVENSPTLEKPNNVIEVDFGKDEKEVGE